MVQHSYPYMTTGKTIALTIWTVVGQVSLLLKMLSRFIIAFLPRSKHLLITCLQSPSTVILEPKNNVCHCFHFSHICLPWSDGTRCHNLHFWMLNFNPAFSLSSFTFIKRLFLVPLHFLPLEWYHLHIWGCWYFSWKSRLQLVICSAGSFLWCTLLTN